MTTDEPDDVADDSSDDAFWGQLDEAEGSEDAGWGGEELEAAYMKAMEALEASDAEFGELPPAPVRVDPDLDLGDEEPIAAPVSSDLENATPTGETVAADPSVKSLATVEIPAEDRISPEELQAEITQLANQATKATAPVAVPAANITPRQILEALMFVGGEPLTTRKLAGVLRGEFSTEFIESQIDELNAIYSREGRPYEIRLSEGGYRMTLREDFERIRRKAYGLGPKEVKLSQEAIEVLAIVAYHQPLTATQVEELGKPGSSGVLRQLVRRELVAVERTTGKARDVNYRTTPRFLSLFGIRSLNELPRHEQVAYK